MRQAVVTIRIIDLLPPLLTSIHSNDRSPDLPNPHILRSVCNYRMRRVFTSHSSSHAVMLSVAGDAFVLGRNEHGQCGMPIAPTQSAASSSKGSKQNGVDGSSSRSGPAVSEPIKLDRTRHFSPPLPTGEKGDIVHAACGRQHTLLVTRAGSVYSAGGNANGQVSQDHWRRAVLSDHRLNTDRNIVRLSL